MTEDGYGIHDAEATPQYCTDDGLVAENSTMRGTPLGCSPICVSIVCLFFECMQLAEHLHTMNEQLAQMEANFSIWQQKARSDVHYKRTKNRVIANFVSFSCYS